MFKRFITRLTTILPLFLVLPSFTFANCFVNNEEVDCGVFWEQFGILFTLAFVIPGLIFLIKPQWLISIQIWEMKKFLGAEFIPSKKTETVFRLMGVCFILIGALFLAVAILK